MPFAGRRTWMLVGALVVAGSWLSGAVKMQVRDGHPVVDGVYVNGHGPYRFLVDTGTNVNLIYRKLATSIGLSPTFRIELASAAGARVLTGIDRIEIGLESEKAGGQEFLISRLEEIRQRWPDIQGVLGQAFLSRFDYTLDLRKKRLEFGKQQRTGTRARSSTVNGRPVVSTNLGDLILDSGVAALVLFGVPPGNVSSFPQIRSGYQAELRTLGGTRELDQVSDQKLVIEGRTVWRGDAVAMRNPYETDAAGLLPLNLFKSIYFCNSEGYIVFELTETRSLNPSNNSKGVASGL